MAKTLHRATCFRQFLTRLSILVISDRLRRLAMYLVSMAEESICLLCRTREWNSIFSITASNRRRNVTPPPSFFRKSCLPLTHGNLSTDWIIISDIDLMSILCLKIDGHPFFEINKVLCNVLKYFEIFWFLKTSVLTFSKYLFLLSLLMLIAFIQSDLDLSFLQSIVKLWFPCLHKVSVVLVGFCRKHITLLFFHLI